MSCAGRSSRSCKSSSLGSRLHNHRTLSRSRVGARVHRRKPHKQWAKVEPLSLHCQELDQRHCSGKQELRQRPKPLSTASPSPSRCTSPRSGKPSTPYRSPSSCPVSSRTTAAGCKGTSCRICLALLLRSSTGIASSCARKPPRPPRTPYRYSIGGEPQLPPDLELHFTLDFYSVYEFTLRCGAPLASSRHRRQCTPWTSTPSTSSTPR